MSHTLNTAASFGPTEDQITDSVLDDGSNLPRYYRPTAPAKTTTAGLKNACKDATANVDSYLRG